MLFLSIHLYSGESGIMPSPAKNRRNAGVSLPRYGAHVKPGPVPAACHNMSPGYAGIKEGWKVSSQRLEQSEAQELVPK